MRCPVSGAWGDVGSADGAHHPNRNGVAARRTEPSPTPKRLVAAIAARNNATPAQVALAWILAQHPTIVPIPGTTKLHRLQENTAADDVELSPADLEEITSAANRVDITADRYPAHMQRWINR